MSHKTDISFYIASNDIIKRLTSSLKVIFQEVEFLYTQEGITISQIYQCVNTKKKNTNLPIVNMLVVVKLTAAQIGLNFNPSPCNISQKYSTQELAAIYNSTSVKNSSEVHVFSDFETGENTMNIKLLGKNVCTYERQVNVLHNQNELYVESEGMDTFKTSCNIQASLLSDILKPLVGEVKLTKSTSAVYCKSYPDSVVFYVLDENNYLKGIKSIPFDNINLDRFKNCQIDVSDCIYIPKPILNFIKQCVAMCDKNTNVVISRNIEDNSQVKFDFTLKNSIGNIQAVVYT